MKEKRYQIETLSTDRLLNKEHLYCKMMQKNVHQRLVPDLSLILVNNPKQPLHARNSFKEDYQKALKKLIPFFLPNPVPFNGQTYQKQPFDLSIDLHSSGYKTSSEIPLLVMYYLTKFDDIM